VAGVTVDCRNFRPRCRRRAAAAGPPW
jgi:hypothetical protein